MTEAHFRIQLALPWLLRLADSSYEGKRGRSQFLLTTLTKENYPGEPIDKSAGVLFRAVTGGLTGARAAHVPGALLRYTEVSLVFSEQIPGDAVSEDDFKKVLAITYGCLNHFLDVYRFIAKDSEVRPLSIAEFHQVRSGQGLLVQSNIQRQDGRGTLTSGVFFDPRDPIVLGTSVAMDETAVIEFRNHLRAGDTPALHSLLLLNADMYLRAGHHRWSVIEMNAALDVVVEQKARLWLLGSGTSPADVEGRLEKMNTVPIMKEILLPNLRIPAGADFPWNEWYTTFRHLRNRVIHDAYEPTDAEARASYENLTRLCRFVGSLCIGTEEESSTRDAD